MKYARVFEEKGEERGPLAELQVDIGAAQKEIPEKQLGEEDLTSGLIGGYRERVGYHHKTMGNV